MIVDPSVVLETAYWIDHLPKDRNVDGITPDYYLRQYHRLQDPILSGFLFMWTCFVLLTELSHHFPTELGSRAITSPFPLS